MSGKSTRPGLDGPMCMPSPQMSIGEPQMSLPNLQPQGNAAAAAVAGLNSTQSPKWTNPDMAGATQVVGDMTSVLGEANDLLGGDSSLTDTYGAMGSGLSFVNCLASGDNIAESTEGSVLSCMAKAGIDQLPVPGSPLDIVNTVNGNLDVDNPLKILTQVVSDINPAANIKTGLQSFVDTANLGITALGGNQSESFRKAENLEERNRNGDNTVIAQALQTGVDVVTGDTDHLTDNKAERGERGVKTAWGNAAGDMISDIVHGERRGGSYRNFDEVKAGHDRMRLWNPLTWDPY